MPPKKNLKSSNPKGSLLRQRRTGAAGGRGVWGEFRPLSPDAISVRMFSNRHRQLQKCGEFKAMKYMLMFMINIMRMSVSVDGLSVVVHMLVDKIHFQQKVFIVQYLFSGPYLFDTMFLRKDCNR